MNIEIERKRPLSIPAAKCMLRSERGAALLLVIVLSTIALVIMTTVMYMIMMGTEASGRHKRYHTACEAVLGGVEVIRSLVDTQSVTAVPGVTMVLQGTYGQKLAASDLSLFDTTVSINTSSPATYDLTVDLGDYRVYAKMTQKKQGNTQAGYKKVRVKTGVQPAQSGMGQVLFTYYTFDIVAQSASNPNERCRMDLVHIY